MSSTEELFNELRSLSFNDFKTFVQGLPEMELKTLKQKLDDAYYNTGDETIQDYKYDWIKDVIAKKFPDEELNVGAPLREGENRVKLPYWLGSMDKIYPEDSAVLDRWIAKNPSTEYVISEKLDGVSCLLTVEDGEVSLLTRGDGLVGADISYLRPFLKGIPRNLEDTAIRGELIMAKSTFEKNWKGKYANPRNLVSGVVNSKTLKEPAKDVEFIAYEIVSKGENPPPSEQLAELKKMGFRTPKHVTVTDIDADILRETLMNFKNTSLFEIDGIIVQSDVPYFRNTSGNPDYAFAFKMMMEDSVVETEVIRVEWNLSKRGYLKPRLELRPISTGGVVIKFATAFNAKFVEDNKLGPGAKVLVTRSGDVIPYIVKVSVPAEKASMPDIPYVWNDTHVDILSVSDDRDMCIQLIVNFFQTFGIKFVSEATVNKLFDNGIDTLYKIITTDVGNIAKIEGMGLKSAQRIKANIETSLREVTLAKLMSASGVFGFGFGEKKFKRLVGGYPTIFSDYKKLSPQSFIANVTKIEGFSDKTASKIHEGMMPFLLFMKKIRPLLSFKKPEAKNLERFKGMKVVFTGFRDTATQEKIEMEGGQVTTSVSKNTSLVVASNPYEGSGKVLKAKELGIKLMSREAFMKEYFDEKEATKSPIVKKSPPKIVMDPIPVAPKKTTQKPLDEFLPKVVKDVKKVVKSPPKPEKEQAQINDFFSPKKSPSKKIPELPGNIVIRRGNPDLKKKLVIFDFDSTLVKPKGGRPFPTNKDDWMWLRKSVPEVIKKLNDDGNQIVIMTNQTKNMKVEMIKEVVKALDIPIVVIIGVDEDSKKPSTKLFLETIPEFDKKNTLFFVGDAGGRSGDWSDMDKVFAANLGVEFHVPEEIFPPDEIKGQDEDFSKEEEVVVMVGLPAVGKTTFAKRNLKDYKIISGDVLKTEKKMIAEAERLYQNGDRKFVFDATNVTAEKRAPYLEFAKKHSLPARCIVLESAIEDILERNKQRAHEGTPLPPVAIYVLRKKFVMPTESEGCEVLKLQI